jgi:hypothetical protein
MKNFAKFTLVALTISVLGLSACAKKAPEGEAATTTTPEASATADTTAKAAGDTTAVKPQ